ncbi:MAG TPA: hypothetical protein VGK10_03710 [Prolixibacteraceae bacterium]|jgi:hypothetical protein
MKKILIFVLVTVLAIGSGYAQQRDPGIRLRAEIEGLTNALGLSQDEVAKITPIVTEAQEKQIEAFSKMRVEGKLDRFQMHDEITKMRAETDNKLKEVLSPEQGVKLDAHRKKQAQAKAKKMQGQ